jgi:vacuolar-type H+-ATPase subunit F/Vma7
MNEKQRLIEEIEQAPDFLVKEVLDFLLLTKDKTKYLKFSHDRNSAKSLKSLLLAIPDLGEDSDFERVSDLGRDIDL